MRYDLKLAQISVESNLRNTLRLAVVVFSLWALGVAGLLWKTQSSVAEAQASVASRTKSVTDAVNSLSQKRAKASRANLIREAAPERDGGYQLTADVTSLAQAAGAEVRGVQIESGTGTAAGSKSASATGERQETFECNLSGPYAALNRFLGALSDSSRLVEFTSIQITPADAAAGADDPRLLMKLTGLIHGLPGKQ